LLYFALSLKNMQELAERADPIRIFLMFDLWQTFTFEYLMEILFQPLLPLILLLEFFLYYLIQKYAKKLAV
jgi:hypothetical protein